MSSSPYLPSGRRWALVLEHRERLQRLVRARLPEPCDVEDVVQEALIRAVCFADLDEARVGALLTTTALRLCADTYRTRARQQRMLRRIAVATPPPGPEEIVCDRQLGQWLMEHLEHLPGRERQVLLARASGLSTTEAASRFRISTKAAEGAFTRGRARLRRLHERDTADDGTTAPPPDGAADADGCGLRRGRRSGRRSEGTDDRDTARDSDRQ